MLPSVESPTSCGACGKLTKTIKEDEQFSLDLTGAVDTTGCGQGSSLKQQEYCLALESPKGMG